MNNRFFPISIHANKKKPPLRGEDSLIYPPKKHDVNMTKILCNHFKVLEASQRLILGILRVVVVGDDFN